MTYYHIYSVFLIVGILSVGHAVTPISKAYDGKTEMLALKNNIIGNTPPTPKPPPRPNNKVNG